MTGGERLGTGVEVVLGVDPRLDVHVAVALDRLGSRLLAEGYGWRRLVAAGVMVVGMIGLAVT